MVLFAQGRDLSGQRPDETNAVCRRAGNEVVVPTVRHSVYGCMLPVHALKVPFLPSDINLIVAPNAQLRGAAVFCRVPLQRLLLQSLLPVTWSSMKIGHCNNAKSMRFNLV